MVREVGEAWGNATDEERWEFEESGAGDMLGQIIEFLFPLCSNTSTFFL